MFGALVSLIILMTAGITYGVLFPVLPKQQEDISQKKPSVTQFVFVPSSSPSVTDTSVLGINHNGTPTPLTSTPQPTITPTPSPTISTTTFPTKIPTTKPSPTLTIKPSPTPTSRPIPSATPTTRPTTPPTPTFTPMPTVSIKPPASGLNPDIMFSMVNDFRKQQNKAAFQKDATTCSIAQRRAPEVYDEIFVTDTMHAGLKAMQLPYRVNENIIYYNSERGAVDWWLNDYIHRQVILSDYTYSCIACYGKSCSQIFTNYIPK